MNKLNVIKFSAVGFMLILLLLHLLDSSVNPNWQPISEYALGNYGWFMNIAFILLGISFFLLGISIFKKSSKIGPKVGAVLLIIGSIGNFLAGIFNTDPITTNPDDITFNGKIHGLAAGFLGFMILATVFLTYQFFKQETLKPYKKLMLIISSMLWLSEITLIVAMGYYLSKTNGMISEETPIGWYSDCYNMLRNLVFYMR